MILEDWRAPRAQFFFARENEAGSLCRKIPLDRTPVVLPLMAITSSFEDSGTMYLLRGALTSPVSIATIDTATAHDWQSKFQWETPRNGTDKSSPPHSRQPVRGRNRRDWITCTRSSTWKNVSSGWRLLRFSGMLLDIASDNARCFFQEFAVNLVKSRQSMAVDVDFSHDLAQRMNRDDNLGFCPYRA